MKNLQKKSINKKNHFDLRSVMSIQNPILQKQFIQSFQEGPILKYFIIFLVIILMINKLKIVLHLVKHLNNNKNLVLKKQKK
ncbi:unnamed protein product [Paramecium sonneborni]|uniref:Transmembrane protein n=1 Tax=Paramecium sonneborni TaxID=65129 RepID=A0A8S1JTX3_9CILI|nr:unnamed protein product [Paramecium sonneborni]